MVMSVAPTIGDNLVSFYRRTGENLTEQEQTMTTVKIHKAGLLFQLVKTFRFLVRQLTLEMAQNFLNILELEMSGKL